MAARHMAARHKAVHDIGDWISRKAIPAAACGAYRPANGLVPRLSRVSAPSAARRDGARAAKQELHERDALGFEHQHAQGGKETGKAGLSLNGELMARWRGGILGSQYNPRRSPGLASASVSTLSAVKTPTLGMPRGLRTSGRQQTRANRMLAGAHHLGASLCCGLPNRPHPLAMSQDRPTLAAKIAAGARPAFAVERGTRTPRRGSVPP
jgi:hypothetical protein